uniref:Conserved oligomeric Golgi complex subunit 6 n=1 Tax=Chlamydomonas leiostraca TaxID=1034604 RepID=A0A7S0RHC7_9CHLO|mmetsp:Transcript_22840/g.58170  ORF Transcript_22840/g.58170 Transcript_22840/m.58170 type:complete len:689 (+) Transcript_22840:64-2130(+)
MASNTPMTASLAPGLARKVKKILDIKTETPELIDSLSTLSSFYNDNTPASRRALRSTIEQRSLDINEKFITAAEAVIKVLDQVQGNLDGLSSSCGQISSILATTKTSTSQLLGEMERLQQEYEAADRKSQLVANFLEQYQLTPDETAALQGEEVNPKFFAALARVRQIHDNCRSLLRTHHQRAGLELMDVMATHQETAYERLCRWVQAECRNISDSDAPEVDSMLQVAVRALRERPVLFKYCAEEVATARHNALFQRFITALSRGGPGGMPRPIELHAHDPKRYINDMLAWVHQSLAGEREFVVALFGDDRADGACGGGEADEQDGPDTVNNPDALNTHALLDRIFESICRPLKVRIEQVLMTSPPVLLCFQLAQLHSFYLGLITRAIGPGAQLTQVLRACRDMAQRVFLEQIRARGDKLVRNAPAPPKDLSVPPQVAEAIHGLLEVVNAHESAMESAAGSGPGGNAGGVEDLGPVLGALLDPLVDACERSAEALKPDAPTRVDEGQARIDPSARHVYLINCLAAATSALVHRPSAAGRIRQLADVVDGHISALVGGEVGRILAACGLAEILDRLHLYQQQRGASPQAGDAAAPGPASDPALSMPAVVEAMRAFFVAVSSPDALPEFLAIQAPRTRSDVVQRIARSLAEAYETAYGALDDPLSGYLAQGGSSAVKHTPAQVRTILGVI